MNNKDKSSSQSRTGIPRYISIILITLNIVLLSGVFTMYALHNNVYETRLQEENLGNIANLNHSSVVNARSLFDSWRIKLNDIAQYVELHQMQYSEALELISEMNSNEERCLELIGSDYTGVLAKRNDDGSYPLLDYSHSSYSELHKIFDGIDMPDSSQINFAPEYTDSGETAAKHFAIYKHITLRADNGEPITYTLMLATESENVLELLNAQSDYEGQSTVLIDAAGNYIVGSNDYKSSNFFQYLYIYNDLTLDQKNEIIAQVEADGSGELYFQNAATVVEDCVFRYERMAENGWYCISCVPLSSFHSTVYNIHYIFYAVTMLVVLFAVDLSWMQSMNRRLRVSMLREKEASSAKGNFMSRMSHEIRTPLNAVIGYNTIARNELGSAKTNAERIQAEMKVLDCLSKSEIASKHLLTIINDVLDMSAIESGKIKVANERFDFKGLITSLTTVFYTQASSKGVEFEVVFDTLTEEWFMGDQMRTNQILTNLLSNAVKFTPEGGSVTLKIHQPEAQTNASHIHFEVTDTGIGMTQEYLSHLWTPFEQADSSISRRFGGTGLGLSITKNLIDIMGGSISVTSTLGVGSTFAVDLTFGRTEQPVSPEAYDFSAINALVVDDEPSTCDYIRLLFNRCGASCAAVTSGADAIEAVRVAHEHGEAFSVCLIDWRMPQMDGIETVCRIREIVGDKMPIVVLTAYDYAEIAERADEIGVSRFLSKPLFQSSLFDLLANISGTEGANALDRNESYDFGGANILLAEDNAMNMEIAKTIMESAGLVVESAWNGREAVDIFESSAPGTFMAILMDVHMPEMDGHEATRTIRASSHPEAKSIPIIAMTADAFAENVAEALAAGMNEHIAKPIDISVLFGTLQKYANKK